MSAFTSAWLVALCSFGAIMAAAALIALIAIMRAEGGLFSLRDEVSRELEAGFARLTGSSDEAISTKRDIRLSVSEDVEARLVELLENSPDAGAALTIVNATGKVLGVLLTIDEYNLLDGVVTFPQKPDGFGEYAPPADELVDYEDVFGLGRS